MFQFSACPLPGLCVQPGVPGHSSRWVAPFGNPRIKRLLAATRGLSQQRYVLHRLLVPRHPPCALSSLTFLSSHLNDCWKFFADVRRQLTRYLCRLALLEDSSVTYADSLFEYQGAVPIVVTTGEVSKQNALPLHWWRWPGSNRRPPACKAGALPAELHPRRQWGAPALSVGLSGFE